MLCAANRFPNGLSFNCNPPTGCCAAIEAEPMEPAATNATTTVIRMGTS